MSVGSLIVFGSSFCRQLCLLILLLVSGSSFHLVMVGSLAETLSLSQELFLPTVVSLFATYVLDCFSIHHLSLASSYPFFLLNSPL